ncbi:MAG: hypothetical protein ABIO24_06920 [Saprospiraceae bacterium]
MKNFLKYCLSACCVLAGLLPAQAQVAAIARLDSNLAETGNPFVIHLLSPAAAGKPLGIDFSAWDTVLPPQNILAQSAPNNLGAQYQIDLQCITFDADTLHLPPLTIRLAGGKTAETNSLDLIVIATPAPTDLNDMAELKDIRHEPVLWTDYLPWVFAVFGLTLLILVARWLWRRAQHRDQQSRAVEMPPYELARKKLEVLARKNLWQSGQLKPYYAELTFILREYLQKRYGIPALESTTEETLAYLEQRDFPPALRQSLTETLQQADLVKFAKSSPPEFFHAQALQQVQMLVETTRPQPDPIETPA